MKKYKLMLQIFFVVFTSNIIKAQNPTYEMYVDNERLINSKTYQFDVFILRTGVIAFELQTLQFGLGFDIQVLNGGTVTASIVTGSSELEIPNRPNSVSIGLNPITVNGITRRYFNCPPRVPPGAGSGTIISNTKSCDHPGTRVATFRITNTVDFTSSSQMNHIFSTGGGGGMTATILQAYVSGLGTDITDHSKEFGYQDNSTLIRNIVINPSVQWHSRPNIYSLTCAERALLASLMMDYISKEVIEQHCQMIMITGGMIHSDFDFLPFHRTYIEKLEDFLILKGHSDFVPLPYWDPIVSVPIEFRIYDDVACHAAICDPQHDIAVCDDGSNWFPQKPLPNYLSTIIQTGADNDICDWNMNPTFPDPGPGGMGDCCNDGLSRVIEGDGSVLGVLDVRYHNNVHGRMSSFNSGITMGPMANFRSPAAPIFWLWHAMVDDIWKSWECNCSQSTTQPVDLFMKDTYKVVESERDRGEEPNIDNGNMWNSNDIWVRNQQDGFTNDASQEPIALPLTPVYVYVRVRNRGCLPSIPSNNELKLYWAKASTALSWPDYWTGAETCSGSAEFLGNLISTKSIDPIDPGDQKIYEFIWYPPDPSDYVSCNLAWAQEPDHFCLLARIETTSTSPYGMTFPEGPDLYSNVKYNNNIVWKNVTVVDMTPMLVHKNDCRNDILSGGALIVGNPTNATETYDLNFVVPKTEKENSILKEAEVRVLLDKHTWQAWINGGSTGTNLRIKNTECMEIIIDSDSASMSNLTFDPRERRMINVNFNFLTNKLTNKNKFQYDVIQTRTIDKSIVGGETYNIIVHDRPRFVADAGIDKNIPRGTGIYIRATDIGEPALYNWYNGDSCISNDYRVKVFPKADTEYRLEVIAENDGFKCYDYVNVRIKPAAITSLYPNPVNKILNIDYYAENSRTATLILSQTYGGQISYSLDTQINSYSLDVSQFKNGVYSIVLLSDGTLADSKTITIVH